MLLPLMIAFALVWLGVLGLCARGVRSMRSLDAVEPDDAELVTLSVVIAVKDGASALEETLARLLATDYPGLEIVVVNDRSGDRTAAVLDDFAARDSRVRPVHIKTLPNGWLGKVHALDRGSDAARGELLLFMDADIEISREGLARAVVYAQRERLDHLALLPRVRHRGFGVDLLMATSNVMFTTSGRPWLTPEQRPLASVKGVGAFNLVRASALRSSEGFAWLKMDVADDVALAQLIARRGRSMFLRGGRCGPALDWYPDLWAMIRGLEKNSVGGFTNYRLGPMLALPLMCFMAVLVPLFGLLLPETRPLALLCLGASAGFGLAAARVLPYGARVLVCFPLGLAALGFTLLRASALCLYKGGIHWSGSFYPLAALRAGSRVKLGF